MLRNWWPAILGLIAIAVESTQAFSASHTQGILARILSGLFGIQDPATLAKWNYALRKAGHLFGFGILSLAMLRGYLRTFRWTTMSCALAAILTTAFVALLDETHQMYLPSRTGTLRDVAIDVAGALLIQAFVLTWFGIRRNLRAETMTTE